MSKSITERAPNAPPAKWTAKPTVVAQPSAPAVASASNATGPARPAAASAPAAPAPQQAALWGAGSAVLTPKRQPKAPEVVCKDLVAILSWKRPHDSLYEKNFLAWLIKRLGEVSPHKPRIMAENIVVDVPCKDGSASDVLFSCHVDTVHYISTKAQEPEQQRITYDPNFGHIFLDKAHGSAGSCLGADDGVGVWIMLRMIEAGVPGAYVFHRGEERGGIGSRAMLKSHSDWLAGFRMAIAFDRPGNTEVIVTQGGQTCASTAFGKQLAQALVDAGDDYLAYEVSHRGVFTDTKVYRGVIPECINLGVGYVNQHGRDEYLDYAHACALLQACKELDWEALEATRDPSAAEPETPRWGRFGGHGYVSSGYSGAYGWGDDHEDWGDVRPKSGAKDFDRPAAYDLPAKPPAHAAPAKPIPTASADPVSLLDELEAGLLTAQDLVDMSESEPEQVAFLVVQLYTALQGARAERDALMAFLYPQT